MIKRQSVIQPASASKVVRRPSDVAVGDEWATAICLVCVAKTLTDHEIDATAFN